uniref:Poly(ADP-ribose) polymerase family member 9 n=1 Tax=Sphenodon punctatus TaxID=8508 RepID=A0A8D0LAQ1_SPHPU
MGNMMKTRTSSSEALEDNSSDSSMALGREVLTIPISKTVYEVLKRRETYLHNLLQKKFGCMVVLQDVRIPVQVYRKSLKEGIEISVWMDDLTRHEADTLVNAANEYLAHVGGLAFALLKAGGPEIQEQSERFIASKGLLSAGHIAVTSGGRLPCKQVIHAVGPRWSDSQCDECCLKLEAAIINILKYVNDPENNIKSVAIPALSSGIFGFPLHLCARVIVSTIKSFVQLAPLFGYLQEIHLVNIDEPIVTVMKKTCEELLGENDIDSLNGTPEASSGRPPDSIMVNGLHLRIVRGNIEDQQTAIIVNSVLVPDDLAKGSVSRAILEKAGPSLLEAFLSELQKWPSHCPMLIYTKGHNIACEFLFHVIWMSYRGSEEQKALKMALSKCLLVAQEKQFSYLSFPALVTEALTLPTDEVADIMVEEVLSFAQEIPGKKPDVYFVLPPDDDSMYEVFQTKLKSVKSKREEEMECNKMRPIDVPVKMEKEKDVSSIELLGNSREILEEAGLWIKSIKQAEETRQIIIENNYIFSFGQREHEELFKLQQHFGVAISEDVTVGKAALEIEGSPQAVIEAMLVIECMLYYVQEQIVAKQEEELMAVARLGSDPHQGGHADLAKTTELRYKVTPIESYLQAFKDKEKQLEKAGLRVLKIEKIYNPVLESAFLRIKRNVEGKHAGRPICHRLYRRVPAQFCGLVCRSGFQRTYFPRQDQKYGAGIYFNKNLRNLVEDLGEKCEMDNLICVFEAEVVTGLYTKCKQSYIVAPSTHEGDLKLYDSVVDDICNPEIFVIFNNEQALPQYLLTCSRIWNGGSGVHSEGQQHGINRN